MGLLQTINGWLHRPLLGNVDTIHLGAATFVVLAVALVWGIVLHHMRGVTE